MNIIYLEQTYYDLQVFSTQIPIIQDRQLRPVVVLSHQEEDIHRRVTLEDLVLSVDKVHLVVLRNLVDLYLSRRK